MKGRDEIKDLFSDKLGNFEAQVRPDMWANIASQIGGTTSAVASTGLSLLSKTFIGIGIGAAVITTVLLVTPTETVPNEKITPKTSSTIITDNEEAPSEISNEVEITVEPLSSNKKTTQKVDDSQPKTNTEKEINQDQNFRTDISLIEVKKESPVKESIENKKNVESEKAANSNKEEGTSTKKAVEKESVLEKHELKQPETPKTTYTIEKLPNIFTPDGDGVNDILSIVSEGLLDFNIVVFDNKQTIVFESTNPDFKWDGTDKGGNKVKAGTYGYYIIARDSNGNKVNKFTSLQIRF